ncbi:hypothetical protein ACXET9_07385 [Brachybacterium sp. DNPG3]
MSVPVLHGVLPSTDWVEVTDRITPAPAAGHIWVQRTGRHVDWWVDGIQGPDQMMLRELPGFVTETTGTGWRGMLCPVSGAEGTLITTLTAGSLTLNRFLSGNPRIRIIAPTPIFARCTVTTADPWPTT